MKYVILILTIPLLLTQCNNNPKKIVDSSVKTNQIIELVDSVMKIDSIDKLNDKLIIDSLRHELDSVKEISIQRNISLYRQRNRHVEEINELEERHQFVIDSLKRRVESVNFLTIKRDKKIELYKYDTIFRFWK